MILLTGATGYIGSHTWIELLAAGYKVIGVDNFCNSKPLVLDRIRKISHQDPLFVEGNILHHDFLVDIFNQFSIDGVMHFAALKAVGESVIYPTEYYRNNIQGLLELIDVMQDHQCKNLVFSSSATVYHPSNIAPYTENMLLGSTSPYGWTKYMCEQILRDVEMSDPAWKTACLRYFNPIGAHESGLIGEDPRGTPNNLMPYVTQVAIGKQKTLSIYGDDWPTPDGTGIRDYIHVVDLARGHVKAIDYLLSQNKSLTINLGTGKGYSVLDLVRTFEVASGKKVPYQIAARRAGDVAVCYADSSLAYQLIGWQAERDLLAMCSDSWRWQSSNPDGY